MSESYLDGRTLDEVAAPDALIDVRGLRKYFPIRSGFFSRVTANLKAVDGVTFWIHRGETLGLVGESGSGKSTTGRAVLRLLEPTDGDVRFDGDDVMAMDRDELQKLRRRAQIIFQDPYETLNPRKTVFQAVAEPLRNFRSLSESELRERVVEMLHDVGLRPPEEHLDTYPDQLSGGQRQRVNIARAVVLEPDLLVADEPVSMLDVSLQAGIIKMMNRLQEEIGFSMLYVSHNLSVVRLVSNQVSVMYRGRFVERGTAADVIEDPKHPYTRALVQSLPDLGGDRSRVRLPDPEVDDDRLPSGCRFHPRCPDAMAACREHVPALDGDASRPVACFLHHDVTKSGPLDSGSIDTAGRSTDSTGSDPESVEHA
jgi:oligopeptide/dipeptide ABC transporter ATP-binding protein